MTTWLTTGEEESCGTENKGTAVNKYTCGRGAAHFLWSVFLLFCLYGMPPYFNRFISKVCGNLNIIYSVLKRALLVKSPSSASLHRQNFNVTWQGPQNLYSIRDLNVNCGSNSLAGWQKSAVFRRGQKQPKKMFVKSVYTISRQMRRFSGNCKFANFTQYNMQYIPCNNALLTFHWISRSPQTSHLTLKCET